jgi:hypothetical protein
MDIVERLAQQAAETINGGEFYDGNWYTEGQRQAWRKAMTPAADEIERLRKRVAVLETELGLMRSMLPNVKAYQTGTGDFTPLKDKE